MTILKPALHISTDRFRYREETFSAEASEIRHADGSPVFPIGQTFSRMNRCWDDAEDIGFTLVSHKTGQEVTVAVDRVVTDSDYSEGWKEIRFRPCDPKFRNKFSVIIWND